MNDERGGWINGFIGMAIFSASLPATRVAVGSFDPLFLTFVRASIACCVAIVLLIVLKQKKPKKSDLFSLLIVSLGVVVGFPLFTALALQHITAAHSTVFIGLLPMSTALFGVLRAGDRPTPAFWLFSITGAALVSGFALFQDGEASLIGDVFMVAAIIVCGMGYAEGGKLSRTLGGWQVISWALVISLPVMLPLTLYFWPQTLSDVTPQAWVALAYVSLFSMLIGFVFWYRGLALGGVAKVGQLQLAQPFLALLLASFVLGETVSFAMLIVCVAVVACVIGIRKYG